MEQKNYKLTQCNEALKMDNVALIGKVVALKNNFDQAKSDLADLSFVHDKANAQLWNAQGLLTVKAMHRENDAATAVVSSARTVSGGELTPPFMDNKLPLGSLDDSSVTLVSGSASTTSGTNIRASGVLIPPLIIPRSLHVDEVSKMPNLNPLSRQLMIMSPLLSDSSEVLAHDSTSAQALAVLSLVSSTPTATVSPLMLELNKLPSRIDLLWKNLSTLNRGIERSGCLIQDLVDINRSFRNYVDSL